MNKVLLLISLIFCAGCFGTSHPSQFYVLNPVGEATSGSAKIDAHAKIVLVGPMTLAKYLDRTNMAERSGTNEVLVSDFKAWAEPLSEGIARVLAQNIQHGPAGNRFVVIASDNATPADIQMPLTIQRFDCDERKQCWLQFLWAIKGERMLVPLSASEFHAEASSGSAEAQAQALSLLLGQAAETIGAALANIPG